MAKATDDLRHRHAAEPGDAADARARGGGPRPGPGAQGRGPRLRRLRVRQLAPRVQVGGARDEPGERRDLLHRRPRPERRGRVRLRRSSGASFSSRTSRRSSAGRRWRRGAPSPWPWTRAGSASATRTTCWAGCEKVARELRAYYLIGYIPTNPRHDGKFRKIQVEVRRPGVQVRARKGYYAPEEGKPQPKTPHGLDPRPAASLGLSLLGRRDPAADGRLRLRAVSLRARSPS